VLIHEVSQEECRVVLQRSRFARLACARRDQPYVVPISVYVDGEYLYSFSTVGQKIDWMRANPKVCVELDDIEDESHWTTVLVFGRYEELTDAPADRDARNRARELMEQRREFWLPAAAKLPSAEHPTPVVYRIRIDRLTGRRAARHNA
jgi:nitroimidazol reductase NimA-like FMN-containing flavoprotein (pyridoxamine 5'-phosphate oxidase superfamily)